MFYFIQGSLSMSVLPPHSITPTCCTDLSRFLIFSDIAAATPAPDAASITNCNHRNKIQLIP